MARNNDDRVTETGRSVRGRYTEEDCHGRWPKNRGYSDSVLKMKGPVEIASNASTPRPSGLVVCCADFADSKWRWIEEPLSDTGVRFEFVRAVPRNLFERGITSLNLPRLRASLEAVRLARKKKADVIVTHGPALAAWCGLFARILRLKIPIVAHSFNFTELPNATKRTVLGSMLSNVDRFVVFSSLSAVSMPRPLICLRIVLTWCIGELTPHRSTHLSIPWNQANMCVLLA